VQEQFRPRWARSDAQTESLTASRTGPGGRHTGRGSSSAEPPRFQLHARSNDRAQPTDAARRAALRLIGCGHGWRQAQRSTDGVMLPCGPRAHASACRAAVRAASTRPRAAAWTSARDRGWARSNSSSAPRAAVRLRPCPPLGLPASRTRRSVQRMTSPTNRCRRPARAVAAADGRLSIVGQPPVVVSRMGTILIREGT
jgi:hypothetical protein